MGNYIVVNEVKSQYENKPFKQFFNVHVFKKQIEIHPKMIIMWTYENMAHFRPFKSP
jgi:hypothetical protein